ncbi:hypothetical protein FACS189421_12340 [Bacteroidia bacterium]|nr:hypothetical protein FACS189421_12340 [Bacteroidia bacterium]
MKMKKMMFLMLTLFFLGAASMNAQVKIGGDGTTGPVTGAVLELDGTGGALLLPRVDALPTAANSTAGMQVYLTTNNKVYTYSGTAWLADASETQVATQISSSKPATVGSADVAGTADKLSQARRIILTGDVIGQVSFDGSGDVIIHTTTAVKTGTASIVVQPSAFSFTRLYDEYGDPGMLPATGTLNGPALTVVANGETPAYNWQWRKVPDISWTDATAAEGTGFKTASFTPKYTVGVDNWGLYEYQCIVTATTGGPVTSAIAQVAAGCGAKSNPAISSGWLRFQCQNLGAAQIPASTSLNNVAVSIESGADARLSDGSNDAKGWLFQWGRDADGHQLRNSQDSIGQVDLPWGDPTGSDKFYVGATQWNLRDPRGSDPYATIKPCPASWIVPSLQMINSIYDNNGVYTGDIATARYNRWEQNDAGTGLLIKEKNSDVTTLFIPYNGVRSGELAIIRTDPAVYWTSNNSGHATSPGIAWHVIPDATPQVNLSVWNLTASGRGIRCVAP